MWMLREKMRCLTLGCKVKQNDAPMAINLLGGESEPTRTACSVNFRRQKRNPVAAVAAMQLPAPQARPMVLRLSPTAPILARRLEAAPGSRKDFVILCRAVFRAAGRHGTSSAFSLLNSSLRGLHSPLCVWVSVLTSGKNNVTLLSGSSSAFLGGINSLLVPREPHTPAREACLVPGDGAFV